MIEFVEWCSFCLEEESSGILHMDGLELPICTKCRNGMLNIGGAE